MPKKEKDDHKEQDPLRYATGYHAPVLCQTVIEEVITDRGGVYIDATLGGGGHSAALLEALDREALVVGIDQDEEAIAAAEARLKAAREQGRFRTLRGNFGDLTRLLADAGLDAVDGIVLDLGISSHQIDTPERGFSYAAEGQIDMRMDAHGGLSAYDAVNEWDEHELRQVFYEYGEESRASRIARAIVQARPLETTHELADAIRSAVPTRDEVKSLSRIFQALRIAVNREIEVLERVLEASVDAVRPGGRMAVISYHSLEDRRVKRFFRYGNFTGEPVRDLYGHLLAPWKERTRKPIMPDQAEIDANPRARSARLRVAERTPGDRA